MQHSTPDRAPDRARLIGEIDGGPFKQRPQARLYRCDDCTGVFWFSPLFRRAPKLMMGMIPAWRFLWMEEHNEDLQAMYERSLKCECDFRNQADFPPPWAHPNDESH